MHLAGRCIDCGECTRVCPANIPLNLLNKKMEEVVGENFKYRPGETADVAPWFQTYREQDVAEFFK
jgi:Na+-translocating ferredoxin:NAD+ oxidoreductase RnfC subunit